MKWLHALVTGMAFSPLVFAATPLSAFRFLKSVERPAAREEEIVAIPLDSDVYAATRGGLPDLRLINDSQIEAPFHFEPDLEVRQEKVREWVGTKVVSLREDGKKIEVRLQLPEGSPAAEGLRFVTSLTNFERKVRVLGSADGQEWMPLAADTLLFDYSRFMDVNNREVALGQNSFRELLVVLEDVSDEQQSFYKELTRTFRGGTEEQRTERTTVERRPFRIDRIEAWHTVTRERVRSEKKRTYRAAGFEALEEPSKKQTIVTVDMLREPITSLTLQTSSRNFSRRAVVEVPLIRAGRTEWQPVGEGRISSFHFREQHREQLSIRFPEQREGQLRIVIHNEDNPHLEVTGVLAEGVAQRMVFLAQPGKSYRLYYGSGTAEMPRYETATVLANLRTGSPLVVATLGPQTANLEAMGAEVDGPPRNRVRELLGNWVFLGIVIVVVVAVLSWSLVRAGRRLDALPKE